MRWASACFQNQVPGQFRASVTNGGRNAQDFGRVLRAPVAADSSDGDLPVGHADREAYRGLSLRWLTGSARTPEAEVSPQQTGFASVKLE